MTPNPGGSRLGKMFRTGKAIAYNCLDVSEIPNSFSSTLLYFPRRSLASSIDFHQNRASPL
ncbi:hypothetical protein NG799_25360 [Laspinema sp. D1]|uniref:Uncharacterized protein n=1 Tax=Laspinema palackyanum D2a TaxID=2953684 RepID=A0ABT2N0H7_9CYAN|nr:hypothetical protein [Laspinema sp. D2a]